MRKRCARWGSLSAVLMTRSAAVLVVYGVSQASVVVL
jgi:hypothetical protein